MTASGFSKYRESYERLCSMLMTSRVAAVTQRTGWRGKTEPWVVEVKSEYFRLHADRKRAMDPSEAEFLAEKEMIKIIPNFSLDKVFLIGVSVCEAVIWSI